MLRSKPCANAVDLKQKGSTGLPVGWVLHHYVGILWKK